MIEESIAYQKSLFLCFVDLKKAFDRVQIDDVVDILWTPVNYINVIKELNRDNKTRIKTTQGFTEQVLILTGIRQGDNMSPILFKLWEK